MVRRRFLTVASNVKIILAVGGIFVAGAVTGGFVSWRFADRLIHQKQVQQTRIGPTEIGTRLAEQLKLSPEQKEKIRPIISETSDELRKVRREAFSQTAALIEKMDADLSRELTPEQRVLLKDIRAKEEERRKKWMSERLKRTEGSRAPDGTPAPDGAKPPGPPPSEP